MHLPITVGKSVNETVETKTLLDSGAGGIFIDQRFVKTHGIETTPLTKPILVRNVDGTENKNGTITQTAMIDLTINGKTKRTRFFLTGQTAILKLPWLQENNPKINGKNGYSEKD